MLREPTTDWGFGRCWIEGNELLMTKNGEGVALTLTPDQMRRLARELKEAAALIEKKRGMK